MLLSFNEFQIEIKKYIFIKISRSVIFNFSNDNILHYKFQLFYLKNMLSYDINRTIAPLVITENTITHNNKTVMIQK